MNLLLDFLYAAFAKAEGTVAGWLGLPDFRKLAALGLVYLVCFGAPLLFFVGWKALYLAPIVAAIALAIRSVEQYFDGDHAHPAAK